MLTLVCAMAYGDCLVTLSALEQLPAGAPPFRIVGTRVTSEVSGLLRRPLPVTEVLPDKAAFYTIKERGLRAAMSDHVSMRRSLRQIVQAGEPIAFERQDIRNRLLVPPRARATYAMRTDSAYHDRRALVEQVLGPVPPWRPAAAPKKAVRKVLVNPCARYRHRWLSDALMQNLVDQARVRGWDLTVIDPCGQYARWRGEVQGYVGRAPLAESVERLRGSDLYIGPDSFFVHLAYYLGVPAFGFFYADNLYFLLPGAQQTGNWCLFEEAENPARLGPALDRFLHPQQLAQEIA